METLAYGPHILIPLSFGYSIVRYRLMDVDVIMRRSFVHAVATRMPEPVLDYVRLNITARRAD